MEGAQTQQKDAGKEQPLSQEELLGETAAPGKAGAGDVLHGTDQLITAWWQLCPSNACLGGQGQSCPGHSVLEPHPPAAASSR